MTAKKDKIAESLKKYLPPIYIPYIVELMFSDKLSFRISKPRKSKSGDYRPPFNGQPHRISVNSDLNSYAFLITTLHEFAHLQTYKKYGWEVKSHGEEWKREFKQLLIPVLKQKGLPLDIETALKRSLSNLKASSCTDIHLSRVLNKYDKQNDEVSVLLEDIGNNAYFRIREKVFQRGTLRRVKYICKEVNTGKNYLVNRLARVEPMNHIKK